MWRLCDLHEHTVPNEQHAGEWDADLFVRSAIDAGIDVVAVTDHDAIDHCEDVARAANGTTLSVIAGVELSTDRGHLLVLAPDPDGIDALREFVTRVGARPGAQAVLDDVLAVAETARRSDGTTFAQHVVLIGSHVDAEGSLLASANPLGIDGQLAIARRLHALEVVDDDVIAAWAAGGVKQGPKLTLVRGSDSHHPEERRLRATWLYLPRVDAPSLRHAFAVREASVRLADVSPTGPRFVIESLAISGGHHDGLRLSFCERTNAIIGPPNAGKSLIIDAFKFVFGLSSDLPEIETVTKSRMKKCLPEGSTVEVRMRTPDGVIPLSRTVGGRAPAAPFAPIIFSQTELTRRAIAASPAIGLLDLHCPEAAQQKKVLADAGIDVERDFLRLVTLATEANALQASVSNPVDGLAATRAELDRVGGTEGVAKSATATTNVQSWRDRLRTEVASWRSSAALPNLSVPRMPVGVAAGSALDRFVPRVRIDAVVTQLAAKTSELIGEAATAIEGMLAETESDLREEHGRLEAALTKAGFKRGSEVDLKLTELRERLERLEGEQSDLEGLEVDIDGGLVALRAAHATVETARRALTDIRREGCRRVNGSMRTFFAKTNAAGNCLKLDALIEDLKTGTRIRATTRQELRESLDRFSVLEYAVRLAQGRSSDQGESDTDQQRVVAEARRRGRDVDLARLACLWPGDTLELAQQTRPPTPFEELTEGLRALAIKEISFAASELPVISDQPEDAVPTRAIYDSLVPTLREQRVGRQFIIVSHDANIVVASDVEEICVLQANDDGTAHTGSLFDDRVRRSALEHLEGGSEAFKLRAERYAQLGG